MRDRITKALSFVGDVGSGGSDFNWRDAILDALIIAGLNFFTTLSGANLAGVDVYHSLVTAGIAAGLGFFSTLAIKRGLRARPVTG